MVRNNRPLILTLVALFCLYGALVAVAGWEQSRGRDMALQSARLSIERQAAAISEEIDRALLSLDLMLVDIGSAVAGGGPPAADAVVRRYRPYVPSGLQVGLYDGQGRLTGGGRPMALRAESIGQTTHFRRHRDEGVQSVTLHPHRSSGDVAALGQSRAVLDADGAFQGAAVALLDSETVAGFVIEGLVSPVRTCVAIADGDATHRLPGGEGCEDTAGGTVLIPGVGAAFPGDGVSQHGTLTGVYGDRLATLHSLRSFPIALVLSQSLEEVLAQWRSRAIAWGSALAASGILLVVFTAWVLMLEGSRVRLSLKVREEEMAKRQAQESSRQKSQFLSKMSHEFRTPLNAILGFAQIIRDQVMGPIGNEKYLDYAKDIHLSGEHLLSIVNDFLELSKIEAGRFDLNPEILHVRSEIALVLRMVQQRADAKGVGIRFDSIARDALMVADQRALRQILLNLLSNAVKFTGAGGRIDIELEHGPGDCDLIRVRDTGRGVPSNQLERIIQPFEQVKGQSEVGAEGTGLGLPIVKSLAELHGGSFVLASEVGVGTTATVSLPRAAANTDTSDDPGLSLASA